MTQSDKDLLIKDLCARLSYGVKILYDNQVKELQYIEAVYNEVKLLDYTMNYTVSIEEIKPYLLPLSSMTEEQYYELQNCSSDDCLEHIEILKSLRECTDFTHWPLYEYRVIDWFNKNHFDYRGLIEKGLAIDATNLNIY